MIDLLKTILPPVISVISIIVSAIIVRIKSKREQEMKREEELFSLVIEDINNIKEKLIDPKDFISREEFQELKSRVNDIAIMMNKHTKRK